MVNCLKHKGKGTVEEDKDLGAQKLSHRSHLPSTSEVLIDEYDMEIEEVQQSLTKSVVDEDIGEPVDDD